MATRTLPPVTLNQCQSITGIDGNHAGHVVFSVLDYLGQKSYFPIGRCAGKRDQIQVTPPEDPFHGLDE